MSSLYGGTGTGQPTRQGPTGKVAGYKQAQMQNFTPEQMDLFKSMFGNVGPESFTSKLAGGDEETFNQMEAPALRQFSGLQGNIASRFSGMGSGARKSSGFQNTMNAASSDFASDLQSKRMGLQQNAIRDLMSMSSDLLGQKPYENFLEEPQEEEMPWWQKLISGAAPIAGAGAGFLAGGPGGAMAGYNIGNQFGKAFR